MRGCALDRKQRFNNFLSEYILWLTFEDSSFQYDVISMFEMDVITIETWTRLQNGKVCKDFEKHT